MRDRRCRVDPRLRAAEQRPLAVADAEAAQALHVRRLLDGGRGDDEAEGDRLTHDRVVQRGRAVGHGDRGVEADARAGDRAQERRRAAALITIHAADSIPFAYLLTADFVTGASPAPLQRLGAPPAAAPTYRDGSSRNRPRQPLQLK